MRAAVRPLHRAFQLDLGRLTDDQRAKVFEAFGARKADQLDDRGIRRRLAPMLGNDRKRL